MRNLAFNGYNSSFFSPLSAEMGALWIASLLAGALKLPSDAVQRDATDRRLRWMEERTEGKHARGTNIIPFSMHQIDELLADMDLSIGPVQRFMEWQMPVKPGNYARVAKELHRKLDRAPGASASQRWPSPAGGWPRRARFPRRCLTAGSASAWHLPAGR